MKISDFEFMWGRTIRSFEAQRLQGSGGWSRRGRPGVTTGKVAHTEVLTLLETHVGHGVIHSLEGRSRYVRTAHLAGKGTGPASLL